MHIAKTRSAKFSGARCHRSVRRSRTRSISLLGGPKNRGGSRGLDIRQNYRRTLAAPSGGVWTVTHAHKDRINLIKNAANKQEFSKINVTFDFLEPPSYQALCTKSVALAMDKFGTCIFDGRFLYLFHMSAKSRSEAVRIGLAGLGNVGFGVFKNLEKNAGLLKGAHRI